MSQQDNVTVVQNVPVVNPEAINIDLIVRRVLANMGTPEAEHIPTVDEWFACWLKIREDAGCKKTTLQLYEQYYRNHVQRRFGEKRLTEVKTAELQGFFTNLAGNYTMTYEGVRHVVSSMFCSAWKKDLVVRNPVLTVDFPKTLPAVRKRALTKEEEKHLFEYARNSQYYDMLRLAFWTGLRIGELSALDWRSDVDLEAGTITVRHTLDYVRGEGLILEEPKSEASKRTIPLIGKAVRMLRKRKSRWERKVKGHNPDELPWQECLVFTSSTGMPVHVSEVSRELKKVVQAMNRDGYTLPARFSFHVARHTFATRCLEHGMDVKVVQTLMGHAKAAMTMDTYADALPEHQRAELNKISRWI